MCVVCVCGVCVRVVCVCVCEYVSVSGCKSGGGVSKEGIYGIPWNWSHSWL